VTASRYLVVSADDYGLTEGISRGILRAHREGIVTSTSVLANGPALAQTAPWLADAPALGVGLHLCAVGEDPPLLSAREIPSLVDRRGQLHRSWKSFFPAALAGRIDPADLTREFSAQWERTAQLGLRISHLDTHQHIHLWPLVRTVVLALARGRGLRHVRTPRSSGRRLAGLGVNLLSLVLTRELATARLATTAAFAGFDEAGHLDLPGLTRALDRFRAANASSAELCTHPGDPERSTQDRYAWGYDWRAELAVLTSPAARAAVLDRGFRLASYHELPDEPRPSGAMA